MARVVHLPMWCLYHTAWVHSSHLGLPTSMTVPAGAWWGSGGPCMHGRSVGQAWTETCMHDDENNRVDVNNPVCDWMRHVDTPKATSYSKTLCHTSKTVIENGTSRLHTRPSPPQSTIVRTSLTISQHHTTQTHIIGTKHNECVLFGVRVSHCLHNLAHAPVQSA